MNRMGTALILTLTLVSMAHVATAQKSPKAFLVSQDKKLAPLLKNTEKNEKKIIKVVNRMLDFDTLCQASLGKHWESRSDEQRKEFTQTLKALIEKNLIKRFKNTKDRNIAYESERVDGDTAAVTTMVKTGTDPRAESTEIVYKLRNRGKGWAVIDMVTDGISLVGNYRSQFNKIISEDGWDALMKKMKDKLAE
ncbi:MAG: ABC transporter substrate-binding protein [Myxococcota bacterium]|nr:ABC transporter substrate-binding protein [Myxococcota bacterium]